jgi:hypothetical protein
MDAGPSYSYKHGFKYAKLLVKKGKQDCVLQAYSRLFCTAVS